MFLLYGFSPSGKTDYFRSQYPKQEIRIMHASTLEEMRNCIASVDNMLLDSMPTLVNAWFDLDCKEISDLEDYDVYIEAHYLESQNGVKEITSKGVRYLYGLRNEHLIRQKKRFLRSMDWRKDITYQQDNQHGIDWINFLGTRYHMFQSAFPDIVK
jgi:hypothetical protein